MKINKKYIESEIRQIVEDSGFFLIELVLRGDRNQPVFEVFVDNESGITADDCTELSKKIHDFLDIDDSVGSNFRLDVSSPGIDRPIKFVQQLPKHINRKFDLKYKVNDETKKLSAELININGSELTFRKGKEEFVIPFDNIIAAKVQISF